MPEGDTIHSLAARLGPRLSGQTICGAASRWPVVADGLVGRTVVSIEAVGKHLLVFLDDDQVVRVHLGMNGGWRRWNPGEEVRMSLGRVALRLDTDRDVFVCHDAPTVERTTRRALAVHPVLTRLGPDLVAPELDVEAVLARIPASPAPTGAELLLDQDVACGIGNIWKNELLFLHKLDPFAPPRMVSLETWRAVYGDAHRRMRAAIGRPRNTTGGTLPSQRLWVYGRGGRPCLRCGTRIEVETHGGDLPRHTWWCPRCQPRVSNTARPPGGEES